MASENSYCRLCAESKPPTKLTHIDDTQKCREINLKLSRLNSELDFNNNLPKTVCFVCLNGLQQALDFINTIEQAQERLNKISCVKIENEVAVSVDFEYCSQDVKEEIFGVSSDYGLPAYDVDNEFPVKTEHVSVKSTTSTRNNKKTKRSNSLDALPLSQLKLTWKDYPWMCAICDTHFNEYKELQSHGMQYHGQCNVFRCTDCNIRKFKLRDVLIHVRRHRQYLKLSCYICHTKFISATKAPKHYRKHVTSDYMCEGCHTCFNSSEELNQHTGMFYKPRKRGNPNKADRPSLICPVCSKVSKTTALYNAHLLTHTDRKRSYTCEVCGKCYFNKQTLLGHMLVHSNVRAYPCQMCKLSFRTLGQLRAHISVHDAVKPFSCEQCGRSFRLKRQLESHSIIHTDIQPYECNVCSKRFRFKTILNQHLRQHTGIKPYSCDICQRDFTNWPNYNKHMKRIHNQDMSKKKRIDGMNQIDPVTGNVSQDLREWKIRMLATKRARRKVESAPQSKENRIGEITSSTC